MILNLGRQNITGGHWHVTFNQVIWPTGVERRPPHPDVPEPFSTDYREACGVLPMSPKASAALSRRCLQLVIQQKMQIKRSNLYQEIQAILDGGLLTEPLRESLHTLREVGNFAAHPIKSTSSGEIVPIEPHEAEWNLDVLDLLFDHLFVHEASFAKRKAQIDAKIAQARQAPPPVE